MDKKYIALFVAAAIAAAGAGAYLGSRSDGDSQTTASSGSTVVNDEIPSDPDATPSTVESTSTTASTPTEGNAPGGRGIIVDGWVLGWWDGTTWQDGAVPDGAPPNAPIAFDDAYDFIDVEGNVEASLITRLEEGCYFERNHYAVGDVGFDRIGVPAGFATQPRSVASIAPAQAHRDDVATWLAENDIGGAEVSIDRVLRVDVDGDGDDEVLIQASKIANPEALLGEPEGSYSVLLLRSLDDGEQVVTTEIQGFAVDAQNANSDSFPGFIEVHRFIGVADVNGDGVFEIATGSRYYEGSSAALLEVDGTGTDELLSAGCGA